MNILPWDYTLTGLLEYLRIPVKCAYVRLLHHKPQEIILKIGYTEEDYKRFSAKLDYPFTDVFGIVWLDDDTWIEKTENDYWVYRQIPPINNKCL